MIISSQLKMSGLYAKATEYMVSLKVGPKAFLAILIIITGVLAALLTNDVIALAIAPVLVGLCIRRKTPFLF